jgi:dihydroflavonol-4-reductase
MIVVTGATGHVGNTLVRRLVSEGKQVRALIHEPTRAISLEGVEVERVTGDICDLSSLEKAFAGADLVYHCAALIAIVPGIYNKLHAINVEGTRNVLEAVKRCGVRRLVYVSSIEAIGDIRPGEAVSEADGFNPDKALIEYGRSKANASLAVLDAIREGLDAVIVSPVGIIGINDYRPSKTGQMILDFVKRKLPSYPSSGGFEFVDVRDVVEVMVRAAEKAKAGEHYLATGGYLSVADIMTLLEEITGLRKPRIATPLPVLQAVAWFSDLGYKLFGGNPVITTGSCRVLRSALKVDGSKAVRELGVTPTPLRQTFVDTLAWFREHGKL